MKRWETLIADNNNIRSDELRAVLQILHPSHGKWLTPNNELSERIELALSRAKDKS